MLSMAVPGTPGQDYPIFSEVPMTSFSCEGRAEGGFFADAQSRCQPFHICANDGEDLKKFSFLCPNGTLFSQVHWIFIIKRQLRLLHSTRSLKILSILGIFYLRLVVQRRLHKSRSFVQTERCNSRREGKRPAQSPERTKSKSANT